MSDDPTPSLDALAPSSPEPRLNRSIGLRTVVSTSAGLTFASSTFLVVVQVANYLAGDSAWIAILIAGLLCTLAAAAFSELNGMLPSVKGIQLYLRRAFGEKLSLVVALTYMSVVMLVVGTEAYVLSHVLSTAIPAIPPPVWIFLMLTLATVVNFRGIKVAGALQDIVTYSVVASIVVMSLLGLSHAHFSVPHPFATGGANSIFTAVGVSIFLFVGFEWVTPLADEVRDPRSITRGMFIALLLLTVCYGLIATAMYAVFPDPPGRALLFGSAAVQNPTPHLDYAGAIAGGVGRWWMIGTSLCMSLTTFNAGLISVSRFILGMARDKVLADKLEKQSTYGTPENAVILVYILALIVSFVVYFTQKYVLLVNLAAATESFIYAFAAAAVVRLRYTMRDGERPYRMWGGIFLPALTALLFAAVGVGVFFPSNNPPNGFEFWGAGVVLALVALAWGLYIHFSVIPKLLRHRAERAEATANRKSRRPPRPAAADETGTPTPP